MSSFFANGRAGPGTLRNVAWASGIAVFATGMFLVSTYSFLLFHGLVEIISVAMGWSIFFLAWNTRRYSRQNGYLLFLSTGYFMVGLVGLLHTLAYKGMNVFPGYGANLPTQFWIVARYLEAVGLLGAPLLFGRRASGRFCVAGWTALTALLLWFVFTGRFPVCYVDGVGLTRFKVASEYVVMGIMVLAGVLFALRLRRRENRVLAFMLTAVAASIGAELAFTFYVGVYDFSNLVGHFLKLGSFLLIYLAIVVEGLSRPLRHLFRDLKETEDALRASEDLLNEAGAIGRIGGWQVDVDTGRVIWSREVYRIHGVGEDFDLNIDSALAFYHPDDRPSIAEALKAAMTRGEPYDLVLRFRPATGGKLWVRAICRVGMENGRPKLLTGVFQDITDQKRSEDMRMDVDRIMRHDLRVPLTALITFPGFIREEEGLSEDSLKLLDMIEESGRRMLRMLDLSRDLFKMENGEYEPSLAPVNMVLQARKSLEEHGGLARGKRLTTAIRVGGSGVGPGTVFRLLGDDLLLHTALSNLVLNALEAAPADTAVTISMDRDGDRGVVRVHNQGVVPQEVRNNFFGKYVTHGKRDGTGLGTYSARLITNTLGGEMGMETSERGGTTVSMKLPLA